MLRTSYDGIAPVDYTVRPTERGGISFGAWTNRGPGVLVNANVDACTASYYNPFCATKMHKIAPFSSKGRSFQPGGVFSHFTF